MTAEVPDAVARERQRIARQLHDGPVQDLTAALLFLDGARQADPPDPRLLARGAETLRAAIDACRALMDDLSADLGP